MQKESIYDKITYSEKEVARFLKNIGIKWSYKHPIFVWDENKRPRVWAPDFYLIPFGIYIEVCGSENFYYPDECDLHEGMSFKCTIIEAKTYPSLVNDLIKKALDVLNNNLPDSRDNCEYCKWNQELNKF